MRRTRLTVTLCAGLALGCSKGATPTDAGQLSSGGPVALSSADTSEISGGTLVGYAQAWRLQLTGDGWRRVNEEPRKRLRPDADVWAIDLSRGTQLTVSCSAGRVGLTTRLEKNLKAKPDLRQVSVLPVEGPWLAGAVGTFEAGQGTAALRYAVGAYELGATACEVQAWELASDPSPRASTLVRAFVPAAQRPLRLAARLARLIAKDPRLQGPDAGQTVPLLVSQGVGRLPTDKLLARFELRRALLARLDAESCGRLVLQEKSNGEGWLEAMTDAEVEAWGEVTEAALVASLDQRPLNFNRAAALDIELRWQRDHPDFIEAQEAMTAMDRLPPRAACEAERTRLERAALAPVNEREAVLRLWAGVQ